MRTSTPATLRKRIVYLDHTAALGGGEIALLNLVAHLDTSRFEPIVILFSEGPLRERLERLGIATVILPLDTSVTGVAKDSLGLATLLRLGDAWKMLRFIARLSRLLKMMRADLVHTNSLKSDILGAAAAKWARIPLLCHVRDRIADDYLPKRVAQLFRIFCWIVPDVVVANSAATLSTLRLSRRQKCRVVHDGTPLVNVSSRDVTDETQPTRIILVGRICRWKGQHVFLQAAAIVHRSFPQAHFQIVGSALFGEEDYEKELHALVRELKLSDVVEFTGFRNDVMDVIGHSDILVHASITGEPFGQVLIEGMAAGKPVVATRGGGVPEIVLDGVTGLLVPMGEMAAMAKAMSRLLANSLEARRMGEAGRQRVFEHFQIAHTVEKVQAVYTELLSRLACEARLLG